MLYSQLNKSSRYYAINDNFSKAFEFIMRVKKENLLVGRYEIDGDNIFAIVQEYESKESKECRFEGHRKYIDIQCVLSGTEIVQVVNISDSQSVSQYVSDNDIEFFECKIKPKEYIIKENDFCVLWPSDIHKPGICFLEHCKVKKIVVKVKQ